MHLSTWNSILGRAEAVRVQLEAIPQKWDEYCRRLDAMTQWMDAVDAAVAKMTVDVETLDNFNVLKCEFQDVCSDVDSRRDAMKWLVQRLDSLLSYKSDDEGNEAQLQLEALVARYKNLVSAIDATGAKTDLLAKCYTCRQDIHKVTSFFYNSPTLAINYLYYLILMYLVYSIILH